MRRSRKKANTLIFILLLLLTAAIHMVEADIPASAATALSAVRFFIFAGLLMVWAASVRRRLLPSRIRLYMTSTAYLMLFYLAVQAVKYRLIFSGAEERMCWYAYYVPLLIVPTLFLMSCIRFCGGPEDGTEKEWLLLIPSGILTVLVLTNDLHYLVFSPLPGEALSTGADGTYLNGTCYYVIWSWIILVTAGGIIFLIRSSREKQNLKKAAGPFFFIFLVPVLQYLNRRIAAAGFRKPFVNPEALVFCMVGLFEACIRSRLLPCNEDYPGFFARLRIPVAITDRDLAPVYETAAPVCASEEELRESLRSPVHTDEDTLLSGMEIQGGYAFYVTDESGQHRINARLSEANETLSLENSLLKHENEQKEERARIAARSAVYAAAAEKVYPAQKRIETLLADAVPGTAAFHDTAARVSVLNAYVKRKTNFVLSVPEDGRVSLREMELAIGEMLHFMEYCGIASSSECGGEGYFSVETAERLFDSFAILSDWLLSRASRLLVFLTERGIRLVTDCAEGENLPETPLPAGREYTDGLLYLSVGTGEGGAA